MTRDELQRLIDLIVEEVTGRTRAATRCSCHAVLADCCPDRLRGVIDAGAVRVGIHATGGAPADIAALIDHTLLKPDATRREIEDLCREAAQFGFAAVCINPTWVALAAALLRGSAVVVCSVVGFPLGASTSDAKVYEARRAIFDGAREIDMVINIGALKSADLRLVECDIAAVTAACHDSGALCKVIIEAALLDDEEKIAACRLAKAAGADFVKTSTGFGPGRRDHSGRRVDAPGGRRGYGHQGGGRRSGSCRREGDDRRRRDTCRRERGRQDRAGGAQRTGRRQVVGFLNRAAGRAGGRGSKTAGVAAP